jgi:hypothetical protein
MLVRRSGLAICAIAVVTSLATGCGSERPGPAPESTDALVRAAEDLSRLVIAPDGFHSPESATGVEVSGPFDAATYLAKHSAVPHADKALFSKTKLVDGYYRYLTETPRMRRMQIYLYRLKTAGDAQTLQRALWQQEERGAPFPVAGLPDALTEKLVTKTYRPDRTTAEATVSFVSGNLLATVTVRQSATLITDLAPDTRFAATSAKEQFAKLSADTVQPNPAPAAPAKDG